MNLFTFVCVLFVTFCVAFAAPSADIKVSDIVKANELPRMAEAIDPPLVLPIQRKPSPFIINGQDVDHQGKYPWQISLQFFGSHICGGSILNEYYVITAAHCVDYTASFYQVAVGLHKQSEKKAEGVVIHQVKHITRHENYMNGNGNFPNDIAIIELYDEIKFNNYTQPIALETANFDDEDAGYGTEECVISGWGYTSVSPRYTSPDVLQETGTKILSNTECAQMWGSRYIAKGHVCIMDGESSACMGDSGGPLVCRASADAPFRLVGVTSWGSSRCVLDYPGVYTRVSRYVDWVQEKLV